MTSIYRQRALWTGFPGAPGYSNFFFSAAPALDDVKGFFQSIVGIMPTDVTINVEDTGDVFDDVTGNITGSWSGGVGGSVTGTAGGGYSGASGAVVDWLCGTDRIGNRRVTGRTFIVPCGGVAYGPGGQIASDFHAGLVTSAAGIISKAAGTMLIWARPRDAGTRNGRVITARVGSSHVVTAAKVPFTAAVLRSRRG